MRGSDNDLRSTQRWRDLCARLKKERPPYCHFCGEEIDLTLSGRARLGWTLDHLKPLADNPHLAFAEDNLAPAHNVCNAARGGRVGANPPKFSRDWR